jgi:hypothetical protein
LLSTIPSVFAHQVSLPKKAKLQNLLSQVNPSNLHFSGDAFQIHQQLNPKAPVMDSQRFGPRWKAPVIVLEKETEKRIRNICEIVVWQKDEQTLNVADMIAFLCRAREKEGYLGYGTIETLAKPFPGMDIIKLEKAFDALQQEDPEMLGKNHSYKTFWLWERGLTVLQNLYPHSIDLPPRSELVILAKNDSRRWILP